MSNEDIIISLIQMDMKHNQLVGSLEDIRLNGDGLFELGALEIISKLMEVQEGRIDDHFGTIYTGFLKEASNYTTLIEANYCGHWQNYPTGH